MNTVEPIRDINTVMDIADYLKSKNERDYVMFMFGIYTGLRISDILKFRVRDVKGKDAIYLREKKTGKEKRFPLNAELKPIIEDYISDKKDYEYLFKSCRSGNKAISRQQAYKILSVAGRKFNIDKVGTHTLRKTFGYHAWKKGVSPALLTSIYNHSSYKITTRYLGIDQDDRDEVFCLVNL